MTLRKERATKQIFPEGENVFRALLETPPHKVKAVILGQDPYHTPGMAQGLAFSVPADTLASDIPPSLKNIFKELEDDLGFAEVSPNPDLTRWAKEGVLLLNTALTVRAHQAASHSTIGWENFTSAVLQSVMDNIRPTVFILWGGHAQNMIQTRVECDWHTHAMLKAPHPSPLSAYRGFFGSKPFSKTNGFLEGAGIKPINWQAQ